MGNDCFSVKMDSCSKLTEKYSLDPHYKKYIFSARKVFHISHNNGALFILVNELLLILSVVLVCGI